MSTRYFVSVIKDGEQKVCQYGQSDGYPTWTGRKVLEFVRDMDRERFGQALDNTVISVCEEQEDADVFRNGSIDFDDVSSRVWGKYMALNAARKPGEELITYYPTMKAMLAAGELTPLEFNVFVAQTRNTGRDILQCIYERDLDEAPLELFAWEDEYNQIRAFALGSGLDGIPECGVQGYYVIDLDRNAVKMAYNGYAWEYDFNKLPKNIEREMVVRERAIGWLQSAYRGDFSRLDFKMASKGMMEAAENIAISVGVDIQEEYPELMEDGEAIRPEAFGKEFIYAQLMREYERKRMERSVDGLISSAKERNGAQPFVCAEKDFGK